ncbi:MAG TPA: hypothetical protein VGY54_04845 [Polyangiaceae bacterium]|jgi:hypothetical protein|nr:hypothetical protein [Polyangiaceae bacterium]
METRKKSPQEILDAIEEQELDEEVDRVRALSGAELDRELEQEGVNPQELRAGAQDVFERAMRKRAEALAKASGEKPPAQGARVVALAPRAPARRRFAVWLAAAALSATVALLLAVSAVTIVARRDGGDKNVRVGQPAPSSAPMWPAVDAGEGGTSQRP